MTGGPTFWIVWAVAFITVVVGRFVDWLALFAVALIAGAVALVAPADE